MKDVRRVNTREKTEERNGKEDGERELRGNMREWEEELEKE